MQTTPKVSVGLGSIIGAGLTIVAAAGALVAAFKSNDTLAISSSAGALVAGLATINSRTRQTIEMVRQGVVRYRPLAEAVLDGITDDEVDRVPPDALPSDEDEFASPPANEPAPSDLSDEQELVAHDDGTDISESPSPVRPEGGIVPDTPAGDQPSSS